MVSGDGTPTFIYMHKTIQSIVLSHSMKTIKKRLDTLQNGEVVEISIGESNLVHERRLAIIGLANADNVVVQQNGLA